MLREEHNLIRPILFCSLVYFRINLYYQSYPGLCGNDSGSTSCPQESSLSKKTRNDTTCPIAFSSGTFSKRRNPIGKYTSTIDSFDIDSRVQVFESTIRVVGGLLSSHIFASSKDSSVAFDDYNGKLLELAYDLGERLLPAFETKYSTGIPYPRVK